MTTATRLCIRYVVYFKDQPIGEGEDRDAADEVMYAHANRNQHQITEDYRVVVKLREGDPS